MLIREILQQRLEQRRAQERQAFANFNAAHGAVIELEQLLLLLPEDSPKQDTEE